MMASLQLIIIVHHKMASLQLIIIVHRKMASLQLIIIVHRKMASLQLIIIVHRKMVGHFTTSMFRSLISLHGWSRLSVHLKRSRRAGLSGDFRVILQMRNEKLYAHICDVITHAMCEV